MSVPRLVMSPEIGTPASPAAGVLPSARTAAAVEATARPSPVGPPAPPPNPTHRPYGLGIDLGTTSVAAAVSHGESPTMIALGDRTVVMPSVAYLHDDGRVVCGRAAVEGSLAHPERAAVGFKRRLGDPTPLRLGKHTRSAAELLPELVREVLATVTSAEGAAPERVVMTHPATWGPMRLELLRAAVSEAGVNDVVTVSEPVAAAMHYAHQRKLKEPRPIAVYDLGGGTFDVTVLMAHPDHVEILGEPEGIERLGGLDFDDALFRHIDHLCDGALSEADPGDPAMIAALAQVRLDCVLAKEHLSTDRTRAIPVYLPDRYLQADITRELFEDLIRVQVESTVGALERGIRSAGLTPEDLDGVLLIGGGSRIPLVAQMLSERLNCRILSGIHPKHVVALGAAQLAGNQLNASVPAPPAAPIPVPPAAEAATDPATTEPAALPPPQAPSTPRSAARLVAAAIVLLALVAGIVQVLRVVPTGDVSVFAEPDRSTELCDPSMCDDPAAQPAATDPDLDPAPVAPDPRGLRCAPVGSPGRECGPAISPPLELPAPKPARPRVTKQPAPVPMALVRDDDKAKDKKSKKSKDEKKSKKDKKDKKKD